MKLKIEMTVDLPQGAVDEFLGNFENYKKLDKLADIVVATTLLADIKKHGGTPLVLPAMVASFFHMSIAEGNCTLTPLDAAPAAPATPDSPDTFAA